MSGFLFFLSGVAVGCLCSVVAIVLYVAGNDPRT